MNIGITYDLREACLAEGYTEEETAEFDRADTFNPLGLAYTYYAPAALHLHGDGACGWCAAHQVHTN